MPARLDDLARSLKGVRRLLILPHNDPDPDAIASALALKTLLESPWPAYGGRCLNVEAAIVYHGIIGRAENKALVRYLGRPLRRLAAADLPPGQRVPFALVDTQPGAGNNALPPGQNAIIVFDHHPLPPLPAVAPSRCSGVVKDIAVGDFPLPPLPAVGDIAVAPSRCSGVVKDIAVAPSGHLRPLHPHLSRRRTVSGTQDGVRAVQVCSGVVKDIPPIAPAPPSAAAPPGATGDADSGRRADAENGFGSAVPAFAEVCPDVGATSTILASYLLAAGIEPDPPLATALYYGIKTDTLGLMRQAGPEDMAVYHHLQELVDLEALAEIESAQVPRDYFKRLDAALHAARLYDGVLLSYVGAMQRPDMVAELADLLLRLQGTRWAVCMGKFRDELIVSVRTRNPDGGAGWLVRSIVGQEGTAGGHGTMAAGHLPLGDRNPADLARQLGQQVLLTLGVAAETPGRPLLDGPE